MALEPLNYRVPVANPDGTPTTYLQRLWQALSAAAASGGGGGGSGTVTSVGGTGTVSGITLTGTVTTSGNLTLGGTLSNVANSQLSNVATATFKGRITAGSGAPEDLTAAQATSLLDVFTSGAKGLAPASGGGTSNFLRADGTWAAPPVGAGDVVGPASATDNAIARYDLTTGKLIQNSAATVSDDGIIRSATNSGANAVSVPLVNWVMLTADYTLTNSAAEQKLFNTTTNGTLTLPTGVYYFECFVYLTTMSGTSGNMAFDPIGAGTAIADRFGYNVAGVDNATPLNALAQGGSATVTQQTVASMVTGAAGTQMQAHIKGMFRVSTGGTIIPSGTLANAAAAVMKAGSWFKIEKLGESSETSVGAWT